MPVLTTEAPKHGENHRSNSSVILCLRAETDSSAMADVHYVAVLHDVVFAFEAERAFGAGVGFGTGFEKLVPADGFGADEMFFQVGVNGSGSFLGAGMRGNLPGSAFVFP